jgi:hypothetical protein
MPQKECQRQSLLQRETFQNPASDCWSRTVTTKIIDSIICIYGNIVAIIVIQEYYYKEGGNANYGFKIAIDNYV